MSLITTLAKNTKQAAQKLAVLDENAKNAVLEDMAAAIRANKESIKQVNTKEVARAKENGLDDAMIDRLTLNDERIEGMAEGDKLHPLQTKFLEEAALQCGFCTPGFLVAAKALLDRNNNPTETEVRYWLAGNLCRCTGYDKIVRAVMDVAADMRGA